MAVLVVAATEAELCQVRGAETLRCGVGPVEAAAMTAQTLSRGHYSAILQVGIAGARTLAPGSLVIGAESIYADVLAPHTTAPRLAHLTASGALLEAARQAVPEAAVLPIATSGRVGGGVGHEVEAMEGFGVLRVASLFAVPALELRAISNRVDELDRSRWQVSEALVALHAATRAVIATLTRPEATL